MSGLRALSTLCLIAISLFAAAPAGAQERASPPRPGRPEPPPPGSYQRTCRGIQMNGNILRAQCPGPSGAPIPSSIDTNSCRGRDIANDRGYLRCEGGGGGGGPRPPVPPRPEPPRPPRPEPSRPPGDAQAIGYTQPDFRGRQLVIRGPITNLANHPGFNDALRSLQVFRGRVTICADKQFRGQCTTVARSQRDLQTIGMANRISSIR